MSFAKPVSDISFALQSSLATPLCRPASTILKNCVSIFNSTSIMIIIIISISIIIIFVSPPPSFNHLYLYQQTFIPCAAETVGRPSIMSKDLRATLATLSIMRRLLAMIYGDLMRRRKKTWFGKTWPRILMISLMTTRRSTYAPLRSSDLKQCLAQSPSQSLHQEHYKPEKKHRKSVKLSWHHNFGTSHGIDHGAGQ